MEHELAGRRPFDGVEDWWGESVKAIYRAAVSAVGGDDTALRYGPAHIVWADHNFDDESIGWCLSELASNHDGYTGRFGEAAVSAVADSLSQLLQVPEEDRGRDPFCPD